MDIKTIYGNIIGLTTTFRSRLNTFTEVEFKENPKEGAWSASEVYHHILDSSILSLDAIKEIKNGRGVAGTASLSGKAILFSGMFPPGIRFKVPERLEKRLKKISITEADTMLSCFEKQLEKLYPVIEETDQNLTVKHPRLGFFNAVQWFRFTEIHLNHHLRQLSRLKKTIHPVN